MPPHALNHQAHRGITEFSTGPAPALVVCGFEQGAHGETCVRKWDAHLGWVRDLVYD